MNPIQYAYIIYDLLYYPEYTELYLNVVGSSIVGYILVWRGPVTAIHIYGSVDVEPIYSWLGGRVHIHALAKANVIQDIVGRLGKGGLVGTSRMLTMACTANTYRRYSAVIPGYVVRRLNLGDLGEFTKVVRVSEAEAAARLASPHWHYYGAFTGGKLASLGGTYLKLPEIWIIGDVVTLPEHRGRGLAKAVVSAITDDALKSGAMAMLHVDEDNEPAVRVYRSLGFLAIQEFLLIRYSA